MRPDKWRHHQTTRLDGCVIIVCLRGSSVGEDAVIQGVFEKPWRLDAKRLSVSLGLYCGCYNTGLDI